jgi:signal transduction histidine kinase
MTERRDPSGFDVPLWRALAVFRIAALGYALVLISHNYPVYRHPAAAWAVGGVMTAWTAFTVYGYARRDWRRWPLLIADLVVMTGCLLVSVPITGLDSLASTRTLPGIAVAGAVLAWAIHDGRRGAAIAATVTGLADLWTRKIVNQNTLNSVVLLFLATVAVGHVARLAVSSQQRLARAMELEAANRERERLARGIHDSVLQVLSLVARRGHDLGGEAAELGRLAGEQEVALRTLVSAGGGTEAARELGRRGLADLRPALERYASRVVTLSMPATPVILPERDRDELAAAVGAALDNVDRHAGPDARAWVLVEDDPAGVTVTVRDDGVGIAPGRLEQAAAVGRLGLAQSIQGRLRDLGGTAAVHSTPGHGTEIELRVSK